MNTHIEILRDVADRLLTEVNAIARIIPFMVDAYPDWDNSDMEDFKSIVLDNLQSAINRLHEI